MERISADKLEVFFFSIACILIRPIMLTFIIGSIY